MQCPSSRISHQSESEVRLLVDPAENLDSSPMLGSWNRLSAWHLASQDTSTQQLKDVSLQECARSKKGLHQSLPQPTTKICSTVTRKSWITFAMICGIGTPRSPPRCSEPVPVECTELQQFVPEAEAMVTSATVRACGMNRVTSTMNSCELAHDSARALVV